MCSPTSYGEIQISRSSGARAPAESPSCSRSWTSIMFASHAVSLRVVTRVICGAPPVVATVVGEAGQILAPATLGPA